MLGALPVVVEEAVEAVKVFDFVSILLLLLLLLLLLRFMFDLAKSARRARLFPRSTERPVPRWHPRRRAAATIITTARRF